MTYACEFSAFVSNMNHRGGLPEPFPYGIPTRKNHADFASQVRKNEYSSLGAVGRKARTGLYREGEDMEDESSLFSGYGAAQSSYMTGRAERDVGLSLGSNFQQMAQTVSSGSVYDTSTSGVSAGFGGLSQVGGGHGGSSDRSRTVPFSMQRSLSYNAPSQSTPFSALGLSHGPSALSGAGNATSSRASTQGSSSILAQLSSSSGQIPGMLSMSPLRSAPSSRLLPLTSPSSSNASGLPSASYRVSRSISQPSGGNSNFPPFNSSSQDLDVSDFPTLNHSSRSTSGNLASSLSSRGNYGLLSKAQDHEFTIHNEDFPALPNASFKGQSLESAPASLAESRLLSNTLISPSLAVGSRISGSVPVEGGKEIGGVRPSNVGVIGQKPARSAEGMPVSGQPPSALSTWGVQTSTDGTVTNIPVGMVTDHFGIIGLLTFIRAADSNPNLVALALGSDLKSLGLNLTSQENLYSSFISPFGEGPPRPQDIDYAVPKEYFTFLHIRDKLAPIKLHRYSEDLLFYIYYHRSVKIPFALAMNIHCPWCFCMPFVCCAPFANCSLCTLLVSFMHHCLWKVTGFPMLHHPMPVLLLLKL